MIMIKFTTMRFISALLRSQSLNRISQSIISTFPNDLEIREMDNPEIDKYKVFVPESEVNCPNDKYPCSWFVATAHHAINATNTMNVEGEEVSQTMPTNFIIFSFQRPAVESLIRKLQNGKETDVQLIIAQHQNILNVSVKTCQNRRLFQLNFSSHRIR